MTFEELMNRRYSARKYLPQQIEEEKLDIILKAAHGAPTAKNIQPHRIYVIQDPQKLQLLSEYTRCTFQAPTVLLFTYDTMEEWHNPEQPEIHSGVEDVSIVATHVMLQAAELNLGTCWVNLFPNSKVEEAFHIPKTEKSVLLMPIGYEAEGAGPTERHTHKRPLEDVVRRI